MSCDLTSRYQILTKQDLRITAIYGVKKCNFQDIVTINSAVA